MAYKIYFVVLLDPSTRYKKNIINLSLQKMNNKRKMVNLDNKQKAISILIQGYLSSFCSM